MGTTALTVEGVVHEADFVKIALNVIRRPPSDQNVLPAQLRAWSGPDAGLPGTSHAVAFEQGPDGWPMRPIGRRQGQLELWRSYTREEIPRLLGHTFNPAIWNSGFVLRGNEVFLLVTLDKGGHGAEFQYQDKFLSTTLFQWQRQNRQKRESDQGRMLRDHAARGIAVHLFVRKQKKDAHRAAPFIYCGDVVFRDWEGVEPITVRWDMPGAVPAHLKADLGLSPVR